MEHGKEWIGGGDTCGAYLRLALAGLIDECQHGKLAFLTTNDLVQFAKQQPHDSVHLILSVEDHLQLSHILCLILLIE